MRYLARSLLLIAWKPVIRRGLKALTGLCFETPWLTPRPILGADV